jgi:ABC-type bacteriocin/lantibiotic exporter with double-glycine peptidase domain
MQNGNRQFKLPFYRQETPDSCVPACLRMVLAGLGVDRAEPLLRQMCDCTMLGTDALNAVDAARQLGFPLAHKENLTIEQLTNVLQSGCFPIVYVNLLPIDAEAGIHAMVVIAADDQYVRVYDPLVGERQLEKMMFDAAWGMTNRLTILIPGQGLATDYTTIVN